jgi:hypothetical protein
LTNAHNEKTGRTGMVVGVLVTVGLAIGGIVAAEKIASISIM